MIELSDESLKKDSSLQVKCYGSMPAFQAGSPGSTPGTCTMKLKTKIWVNQKMGSKFL